MGTKPTCKGHKKDGSPCHNYALDDGYCRMHQKQAGSEAPAKWTRERLEAAIAEHGGPEGLDLAGADLSGLDLSGMDLHGAVLGRLQEEGALVGANLQGANLRGADLRRANLRGAGLRGACLAEVCLRKACLADADLHEADLSGADLRGADLFGANLDDADVRANLRNAYLQGARLRGARLWGADLRGADLMVADMRKADLSAADLRRADLRVVKLHGAILMQCDLRGAELSGASLADASLLSADCTQVNLRDVADGGLRGVRFYRARLDHTFMRRCQLGKAIAEEDAEEFEQAAETYLALKQNFDSLGDYAAAAWSYVHECRMETMCNCPRYARRFYGPEELGDTDKACLPGTNPRVWRFYVWHTARYLGRRLVDWTCGYGENLLKTLRAMGVAFLVFAAIYWLTWAVVRETPGPSGIPDLVPTRNVVDVLVFSAGAFTTLDMRGLGPLPAWWVQPLMALEALVGIGLTGLLGFVLGNRIRRS